MLGQRGKAIGDRDPRSARCGALELRTVKSYKNVASEVARGSEDIPRAQDPE
jgi:hypothetical protein